MNPSSVMPLPPSLVTQASELIKTVITCADYYNERAKLEEQAKYAPEKLLEAIHEDPDSVLIATIANSIVGFCISHYDDGLLWLAWFGVDSRFRGKGVGSKLLEKLCESAPRRSAHKIWCDTRTDNTISQNVLQRSGFRRICSLSNHWYGQDFILWEKFLGNGFLSDNQEA